MITDDNTMNHSGAHTSAMVQQSPCKFNQATQIAPTHKYQSPKYARSYYSLENYWVFTSDAFVCIWSHGNVLLSLNPLIIRCSYLLQYSDWLKITPNNPCFDSQNPDQYSDLHL